MSNLLVATLFAIAACGGKDNSPAQPTPPAAPSEQAAPSQPSGAPMTAAQCAAAGGEVVGDIGDGAIHRPDYRCPRSGSPPLGPIQSEAGEPVAIEGAVCCK